MTAARHPSRLGLALALTAGLTVFEFAGGFIAHSLALLSDAAHVSMDVFALGVALAAERHARRPATARQTFGFARVEVLAALGNGGLLFAITVLIVIEAIHRFGAPVEPAGPLMFAVAATGRWLDVSVIGAAVLTALFQGSTAFTEELTLAKYPGYADYQRRTSRLVPMPPRG